MARKRQPVDRGPKRIIDSLPEDLRRPLNKPQLEGLTFSDLNTVVKQLNKFYQQDPVTFLKEACGACLCWK